MKKQLLYLVFLLFSTYPSNAAPEAISMVSYEQSWLDNKGTLALKNNTTEKIHNITFIIEYLDMTDTPMDYEEYFRQVNIAPGMTRKVNIRPMNTTEIIIITKRKTISVIRHLKSHIS